MAPQTIFQKLRTITLGAAHSLLDRVIDEMSIPALKQYIRDLEVAIENLKDEAATAEGCMTTANSNLTAIDAQIKELDTTIGFILGDGDNSNDHLAEPLQVRLTALQNNRVTIATEVETYKQTMLSVDQVISALEAKLQVQLAQVTLLESQAKSTAAKTRAAKAIEAAGRFTDGPSVDNLAERVANNSNIADAKLRRAMGDIQTGLGQDTLIADAKAKLAARKAAIKTNTVE